VMARIVTPLEITFLAKAIDQAGGGHFSESEWRSDHGGGGVRCLVFRRLPRLR
jgi:hypothetical protein